MVPTRDKLYVWTTSIVVDGTTVQQQVKIPKHTGSHCSGWTAPGLSLMDNVIKEYLKEAGIPADIALPGIYWETVVLPAVTPSTPYPWLPYSLTICRRFFLVDYQLD